jgi:hypothetical protein
MKTSKNIRLIYITADLVSMNESFVKAKSIYERMMDQSLARIAESMLSVHLPACATLLIYRNRRLAR